MLKNITRAEISDFSKVGIKIIGDFLVEVELEEPLSFFPMLLTHHSTFPIRQDLIDKWGSDWIRSENLATLGPYKIVFWKHDYQILLQSNDFYYGAKPAIKYILFYMIGKESTALRMFERKRLDFIKDLPTAGIKKISEKKEYRSIPGLRLYYFGFKTQKAPFNQVNFRKAIAHAIDRREIVQVIAGGQAELKSWVPKGMFGYSPDIGLKFDSKQAKEYLKKAGYSGDNPPPKIVIGFNTSEKHQRIAENVQSQLKKNLGLQVELKNEEWKTYLSNLKTESDYDIFRLGWVADYPDPDNFLSLMTGYSTNNRCQWKNSRFDELIEKARTDVDIDNRRRLYRLAQKILLEEETVAVPIFSDVNNILVSDRLENFPLNPIEKYIFKDVRIKN